MSATISPELYAAMNPFGTVKLKPQLYAAMNPRGTIKFKPDLYAAVVPCGKIHFIPEMYASISREPTVKLVVWHDGKPYTCRLNFDKKLLDKILGGI